MTRFSGVLTGLLLLGFGTTFAAEGRKEIFEPVLLVGAAANGQFFVSRDITADDGEIVIQILGTGVEITEIDVNGFTLTGNSNPGSLVVYAQNVKSLVLRNGTIASPASSSAVIWVDAASAGQDGKAVLEDLKITGGLEGVRLFPVANFAIRRCFVFGTLGAGINVQNNNHTMHGTIEDNVLRAVATNGTQGGVNVIDPTGGLTILRNTIQSGHYGLYVAESEGLIVTGNYVSSGNLSGINVATSESCTIVDNRVATTAANTEGIRLATTNHCLIKNNVASGIGRSGLELINSDRNTILGNVFDENGWYGLHFNSTSDDNRYGRNSADGNAGGLACTVPGAPTCGAPDLCDEGSGNKSFGTNLVPGPGPC